MLSRFFLYMIRMVVPVDRRHWVTVPSLENSRGFSLYTEIFRRPFSNDHFYILQIKCEKHHIENGK